MLTLVFSVAFIAGLIHCVCCTLARTAPTFENMGHPFRPASEHLTGKRHEEDDWLRRLANQMTTRAGAVGAIVEVGRSVGLLSSPAPLRDGTLSLRNSLDELPASTTRSGARAFVRCPFALPLARSPIASLRTRGAAAPAASPLQVGAATSSDDSQVVVPSGGSPKAGAGPRFGAVWPPRSRGGSDTNPRPSPLRSPARAGFVSRQASRLANTPEAKVDKNAMTALSMEHLALV
jgi:hypothetical protein